MRKGDGFFLRFWHPGTPVVARLLACHGPKQARAGYRRLATHALIDAFSLASVDRATKYLAILAVQLRSVAEPADQDGVALVQHLCDVLAAPGNQLTVFEQRGDVVRRGASAKVACRP